MKRSAGWDTGRDGTVVARLFPNSLAFRLLAMIAMWTSLALLATGLILSTIFRNNSERDFERLLLAHAYNIMGAIDVDDSGKLAGSPNLGDPRFISPLSGWYWAVLLAEQPDQPIMHSLSIDRDGIVVPDSSVQPFDAEFRRLSTLTDATGNNILQLEAQLFVGESDKLFQVLVAGNKGNVEEDVVRFNRTMGLFFSLFGIGTIFATYFVIRLGLKPLFDATNALHDVREGRAQQLGGSYPREIEPLAGEINALISANRSVVERARTQVGNLAHALKSPLAVISNELRSANDPTSTLVAEQAGLMKSQVQTYLDRARIAAQRNVITANTPVVPVLEKLLRVMKKLSPDISFELQKSDYAVAFRGEEQDLEEVLGNLMENASRFAKARVVIDLNGSAEDKSSPSQFSIAVSDDGPGLSKPDRLRALKRGTRLDESQPGSGLGLSIVSDVVSEYGGRFELNESQMGGLKAIVFFAKTR